MSKTDKTNPYWVKIARREGVVKPWRIYHYTGDRHDCDPQPVYPITKRSLPRHGLHCEIWNRWSENAKIYGRRPKRSTRKALGFDNGIRADLRRLRRHWASEPERDTIDSSWGAPRRKCQVRDPWHWD